MKKRIALCFITSTLLFTSSVMLAMELEQQSSGTFVSKDSPPNSPRSRNITPIVDKPLDSLSRSSSSSSSPSLPRVESESRKEARRQRILEAFAPLSQQIEESDNALKAKQALEEMQVQEALQSLKDQLETGSRSGSSTPSGSGSNDEEITQGAADILARSGSSRLVTITLKDGTPIQPYPKQDPDKLSQLPSDGTLARFLNQTEDIPTTTPETAGQSRIEIGTPPTPPSEEPTPKKSLTELNQLRQEEAEKLAQQQAALQTKKLDLTNPMIQQKSWVKQHPVLTTVTGVGISLLTLLVVLYYFDKLPDNVTQWINSYAPKYPRSHYAL